MEVKPEPKTKSQSEELGALMYYEDPQVNTAGKLISFEKLHQDNQRVWIQRGAQCLSAVGKMNKILAPKVDPEAVRVERMKHLDILTNIIKEFVKGLKTTKPEHFPCEELAHRIYDPR